MVRRGRSVPYYLPLRSRVSSGRPKASQPVSQLASQSDRPIIRWSSSRLRHVSPSRSNLNRTAASIALPPATSSLSRPPSLHPLDALLFLLLLLLHLFLLHRRCPLPVAYVPRRLSLPLPPSLSFSISLFLFPSRLEST